uniref:Uncharacterized protein n=1 Tax=Anguilla anguilla TaxID=7936 RepID=A0A0E9RQK3_ANGAN
MTPVRKNKPCTTLVRALILSCRSSAIALKDCESIPK